MDNPTDNQVEPKVLKVAISIPSEGHTLPEAYDNHLLLAKHVGTLEERWKWENRQPRYEFYWHTVGRLLTAAARERLIEESIKGEMDYIIMYDDDMVLPIDMVECLLQDMEQHPEIDVLAPLAFMRNPPHFPVLYLSHEGYDPVRHKSYFTNQIAKKYPKDKLVECDAVGFGAVCIRMSTLKKLNPPYCFSTTGSGEDIFLCYKVKQEAKGRVFMDTRIKLGHLSNPKVIDEETFETYVKEHNVEIPDIPYKYLNYDK